MTGVPALFTKKPEWCIEVLLREQWLDSIVRNLLYWVKTSWFIRDIRKFASGSSVGMPRMRTRMQDKEECSSTSKG